MKPSNFVTRTFTAIVFVVLMVGSVLAGPFYFAALMLIAFALGAIEFYKLVDKNISLRLKSTGIITGALVFTIIFLTNAQVIPTQIIWVLPILVFIPVIIVLFSDGSHHFSSLAAILSGIILLAVPFSLFASITLFDPKPGSIAGKELIIIYFIILWVYDAAAYIIGSLFGKRKLHELISPSKTWEGFIGGLICSVGISVAISYHHNEISLQKGIVFALLIAIFGTIGDLSESMLKRKAGVKDSGTLLPGHGGILDRFDGVLISAPVVYLYLVLILN